MSFPRHLEIYPPMEAQTNAVSAPAHRLDEFPAGYSLAGCSPAEPASASPAGHQYAVKSFCRSRIFQRTVNSVLTVCVSRGGKRSPTLIFYGVAAGLSRSTSAVFCSLTCKGMAGMVRDMNFAGFLPSATVCKQFVNEVQMFWHRGARRNTL
jgi:hypothetical protein